MARLSAAVLAAVLASSAWRRAARESLAANQAEPITAAMVPMACTQAAVLYQTSLMTGSCPQSSPSRGADQALSRSRWRLDADCDRCAATIGPGSPRFEEFREGSRQSAQEGQLLRSPRQALRGPDRQEQPSRKGHAGDSARHAPYFRRGEGLGALPHHRAGGA